MCTRLRRNTTTYVTDGRTVLNECCDGAWNGSAPYFSFSNLSWIWNFL